MYFIQCLFKLADISKLFITQSNIRREFLGLHRFVELDIYFEDGGFV